MANCVSSRAPDNDEFANQTTFVTSVPPRVRCGSSEARWRGGRVHLDERRDECRACSTTARKAWREPARSSSTAVGCAPSATERELRAQEATAAAGRHQDPQRDQGRLLHRDPCAPLLTSIGTIDARADAEQELDPGGAEVGARPGEQILLSGLPGGARLRDHHPGRWFGFP